MHSDHDVSTCLSLFIAFACTIGAPQEGQAQLARSGAMGPRDTPRIERFTVNPGVAGWEIVLETADARLVDLDLYVYGPGGRGTTRLCASEGIERVETCRIGRADQGSITVEIVPTSGVARSRYELTVRALRGATIAGTPLVSEDAKTLAAGAWTSGALASVNRAGFPPWALYEVSVDRPADSRDWIVAATSQDPAAVLALGVYDHDGHEIARSEASGPYQDLRVAAPTAGRLFVLVTSKRLRGPLPSIAIGAFRADAPIPAASRGVDPKQPSQEWRS